MQQTTITEQRDSMFAFLIRMMMNLTLLLLPVENTSNSLVRATKPTSGKENHHINQIQKGKGNSTRYLMESDDAFETNQTCCQHAYPLERLQRLLNDR